jgi:hypothetical protein
MEPLIIEATEISPKVILNPEENKYEISGESRPESVREFFQPILDWIDSYSNEIKNLDEETKKDQTITIHFKLEYFNSSSAKYFLDIIKSVLAGFYANGVEVKIYWHFEEGDEDMQEAGEELSHMVKYPFKYIAEKGRYAD